MNDQSPIHLRTPVTQIVQWPTYTPSPDTAPDGQFTRAGHRNPLGKVKFHFEQKRSLTRIQRAIFAHDTPHKDSFGTAASGGCFRTEGAIDLAAWVIGRVKPESSASFRKGLEKVATRNFTLPANSVVAMTTYLTYTISKNGQLILLPDIYDMNRAAAGVSKKVGATVISANSTRTRPAVAATFRAPPNAQPRIVKRAAAVLPRHQKRPAHRQTARSSSGKSILQMLFSN